MTARAHRPTPGVVLEAECRSRTLATCLLAALIVWPGMVRAQDVRAPAARRNLSVAQLAGSYTADFVAVADAQGIHGAVLGDGNATLRLNLAAAGLPGTHVLLKVLWNHGGKLALGAWGYTGWLPAPGAAPGQPLVHGSLGAYAFGETWLYRRPL